MTKSRSCARSFDSSAPRRFPYVTVDVFTTKPFGGNPVAVFYAAGGLDTAEMQALAAEMNYSETTFVLPPTDPANDARVRIFNRTAEMPFAGHPNIGTAFALARLRPVRPKVLRLEEEAGLVALRLLSGADGSVCGAVLTAPKPFERLGVLPADIVAACVGVPVQQVITTRHPPTRAGVGVDFVLAEVEGEGLAHAAPVLDAFRTAAAAHPSASGRLSILIYTRGADPVRARMFAPLSGTWEDPATGSANAALAALLLQLEGGERIAFDVVQGREMGRPSLLRLEAERTSVGLMASVGGSCVAVFSGEATLPPAGDHAPTSLQDPSHAV
jgi:trans-2,3-dihydro-3-hydroxyanthranilate isomerase